MFYYLNVIIMRKITSFFFVAALLSLFSVSARAYDFDALINGKKVLVGDPIQTTADIEADHLYMVASQYRSAKYDRMYWYSMEDKENYGHLYFWDCNEAVYDGMDATDEIAQRTLMRFISKSVDGYEDGTVFQMQFAYNEAAIWSAEESSNAYIRTYYNGSSARKYYIYNIAGTEGHFGFYDSTSPYYRIDGRSASGVLYIVNYNTGEATDVNGFNDFAIYPVQLLTDEEICEPMWEQCVEVYEKYSELLPTLTAGTNPGDYSEEAVQAFKDAVAQADGCPDADPTSKSSDEWLSLKQTMDDAYEVVLASKITTYNPEDGYFYIEGAGYDVGYEQGLVYSADYPTYLVTDQIQYDANSLWSVISYGTDAYKLVNVGSNTAIEVIPDYDYVTITNADNSDVLVTFDYVETNENGEYVLYIHSTDNSSDCLWGAGLKTGVVGAVWGSSGVNEGSLWKLVRVSDEEANDILIGVSHRCEADYTATDDGNIPLHWSSLNGTELGNFHVNTWSTEDDESGLVTPFVEYWYYETILPDDYFYHLPVTDLTPGETYTITLDLRAFNELGMTPISEGTTINANDQSIDITTGTAGSYDGHYEIYGHYTLLCEANEDGEIDVSITVANANYNWLAWKNLKVIPCTEFPELPEAVSGTMSNTAEAAQTAAIEAYNSNPNAANYNAAISAIGAAEISVAYYENTQATFDEALENLDEAGQAALTGSDSYKAFQSKDLDGEDVSADIMAAYKAQAAGADMTYVVANTEWTCEQGNGPAAVYEVSTETYNNSNYEVGKVMYQHIEGLQEGNYEVTFYAVANSCWVGSNNGD